jgi:predicted RecA/RadA family phage recombinase
MKMSQATYVERGETIDYTPGSDVAAGQVVIQGDFVGVAKQPIAANAPGGLAVAGVFDVVKAAVTFGAGVAVFWDTDGNPVGGTAGSGAATTAASGNKFMGFTVAAAGETAGTVRVSLRSVESASRETIGLADLADVGPVAYDAGKILVADGDSFESVAVSGDVTLAANGAVTIGADKVLASHVKDGESLLVGVAVPDTKEVTFGTCKFARSGNNIIATLPSSDPAVAGALYVTGGAVKVSAGT